MRILKVPGGIRVVLPGKVATYPVSFPAHFALVRDGSLFTVWVDGIQIDSFVARFVDSSRLRLGRGGFVLDEFRLSTGVVYNRPFVPERHQAWYRGSRYVGGGLAQFGAIYLGQVIGSHGLVQGQVVCGGQVIGSRGLAQGQVVCGGQVAGAWGGFSFGLHVPYSVPGYVLDGKGLASGFALVLGQVLRNKGLGAGGDAIREYVEESLSVAVPGEREREGWLASGWAVSGGSYLFLGGIPFVSGQVLQGRVDLRANPVFVVGGFVQGNFLTQDLPVPYFSHSLLQGDVVNRPESWDPGDVFRLMDALGIGDYEQVRERMDGILSLSVYGKRRVQTLLANRDGLVLDLRRALRPVSGSPYEGRRVTVGPKVFRARRLVRELPINTYHLRVATGLGVP